MLQRNHTIVVLAVGATMLSACGSGTEATGSAEDYPTQDVRFIVPYEAGGGTDLLVREIAPHLEESLDTTFVIENVPGGSGTVAMQQVIQSEPDGYTITTVNPGPSIVSPLTADVGYTKDDYATVANIATAPLVLSVRPDSAYGTAEEVFQEVKNNPDTVTIGTPGATVSQTIELTLLEREEGVSFKMVPFDGGSEVVTALLGGHVDAALTSEPDVAGQIDAGELTGLATTADERTQFLPDVPTFKEQGIEPALAEGPYGMAVSADTPTEIIEKLEGAVREALEDSETQDAIRALGLKPHFMDGAELRALVDKTSELYEGVLSK